MKRYKIWDEGASDIVEAENMDQAIEQAEEWLRDGDWGNEGAHPAANVGELDEDGEVIYQELANVEIEPNHEVLIRAAVGPYDLDATCGPNPDDHDWTSEGEGGLDVNPGVWSVGGTAMVFKSHCRRCGLHRTSRTTGSQRNPGEHDTVEYRLMDDEEIATHRHAGTMDDQE